MYCGNCGKQISDDTAFCPDCGAPTGANISAKRIKIPMPFIIMAGLFVVVLVVFFAKAGGSKVPSIDQILTSSNNLCNGGVIASDGKWLYYMNDGLVKEKLSDGKNKTVISDEINAEHLIFWGNDLYYFSFPGYYKLNGNQGIDLGFSVFTSNCLQFDGKRYYVTGMSNFDDCGVYSADVKNTKNGKQLSDIHPTRILFNGKNLYIISGYSSINNLPNENYGTWVCGTDGSGIKQLFEYCPDYMVFTSDKVYYTDKEHNLCSMNVDGTQRETFKGIQVGSGLNASEKYIFYVDRESGYMYRIDLDGSNKTRLNKEKSSDINIAGDWVIYRENKSDSLIKIDFNGENSVILT